MPVEKKLKTILLAEDDKFISKAYSDGLTRAGYSVLLAHDGVEAINNLIKSKPDLLLLDLIMPEKDGFEVLEEKGKNSELKKIPAIVMSNLGQDSDIKRCKDLGAVDYLVKADTSLQEVIERVKKIIG